MKKSYQTKFSKLARFNRGKMKMQIKFDHDNAIENQTNGK